MRFRADTAWAILPTWLAACLVHNVPRANLLCGKSAVVHKEEVNIGDCTS